MLPESAFSDANRRSVIIEVFISDRFDFVALCVGLNELFASNNY